MFCSIIRDEANPGRPESLNIRQDLIGGTDSRRPTYALFYPHRTFFYSCRIVPRADSPKVHLRNVKRVQSDVPTILLNGLSMSTSFHPPLLSQRKRQNGQEAACIKGTTSREWSPVSVRTPLSSNHEIAWQPFTRWWRLVVAMPSMLSVGIMQPFLFQRRRPLRISVRSRQLWPGISC